jgi:RNA-splicing ligase RtcB
MLSGTIHRQRKQLVDVQDALERRNIETAELRKERDYLLANESPTACEVRRVRSAMKDVNDENAKLRELVVRMRPICVAEKRCTFADRIYINNTMEELGIEVPHD